MSQVLAGFTVESTDDEIKSMPLKSPLRIKFEKRSISLMLWEKYLY